MNKPACDTSITVDIVSDIVCPWCWLGLRYFIKARSEFGSSVELRWHPYMLDPTVPKDGVPYKTYMTHKFGSSPSNKFSAMRKHLEEAGPGLGIDFNFSGIPMRPNTLNAHRLMKWAGGQDRDTEMAEALFKAFFTDHKDIGDIKVLGQLAKDVGLDGNLVADLLSTDKDVEAVQKEITYFAQLGISGVPTFIYNQKFIVQGAQPNETHLAALNKAFETNTQTQGA